MLKFSEDLSVLLVLQGQGSTLMGEPLVLPHLVDIVLVPSVGLMQVLEPQEVEGLAVVLLIGVTELLGVQILGLMTVVVRDLILGRVLLHEPLVADQLLLVVRLSGLVPVDSLVVEGDDLLGSGDEGGLVAHLLVLGESLLGDSEVVPGPAVVADVPSPSAHMVEIPSSVVEVELSVSLVEEDLDEFLLWLLVRHWTDFWSVLGLLLRFFHLILLLLLWLERSWEWREVA